MTNLFHIDLKDTLGAVLSAVIVAVLTYFGDLSSIWEVNWQGVLSVAVLTAAASLVKALGTDSGGNFLGAIKVK